MRPPGRIEVLDEALEGEHEMLERAATLGPAHVTEIFRLNWHGLRADRAWCSEFRERVLAEGATTGDSAGPDAPSV